MNIHITLVGGQTAPVYQGILYSNPDKVIFIHSTETTEQTKILIKEISIPSDMMLFDAVSFDKISNSINTLLQNIRNEDFISINFTSGTKPWSVFFCDLFRTRSNTQLFYIDQNANLWDMRTLTSSKIPFNMEVQFRLYGNPLEHYTPLSSITNNDISVIKHIREIRSFNCSDFNQLTDSLGKQPNQTSYKLPSLSEIFYDKVEQKIVIHLVKKNNVKKTTLISPNVFKLVTFAGWFEIEIAIILSKWEKISDIRLNCKFPSKSNSPKNEIDIIAEIGTKLLFVECKTKLTNITDIDKFSNAVRIYGGIASKAILITESPLSETAQEKCKENGVLFFSFNNSSDYENIIKMLFLLLENELNTLNPN